MCVFLQSHIYNDTIRKDNPCNIIQIFTFAIAFSYSIVCNSGVVLVSIITSRVLHSKTDYKNNIIYNNYLASRWCIHNRRIKCLWLPNVTYKILYKSPKFYIKNQRYSKIFEGTSSTVIVIKVSFLFII